MNTLFKIIHCINVLHPKHINIAQKNHLFKFAVKLIAKHSTLVFKNLMTSFFKRFGNIVNGKLICVFKIVFLNKPAFVFFFQTVYIPVFLIGILCTVNVDVFFNT